ncbi:hypothetical protein [Comamonas aquatica]|uniref:hypothetical protein n=1 Tax=Comamonas aquatica TaxID=225991 RepID=UPI0034D7A667
MSITLSYDGETVSLGDRLDWQDEFSWSPVDQATAYSTKGALLVDIAVKQAGRPITLVGTETVAWITRSLCAKLQSWADLPGIELTLVLRGQARTVMFDHANGGFAAQPVWKLLDGEHTNSTLYLPTFRFLEV